MSIINFNYNQSEGCISWGANNKTYKLSFEKIIEAMPINDNSIILVKQGDNFVENIISYLNMDSKVIFLCDLEAGIIEFNNLKLQIKRKIISASINPYYDTFLICTKEINSYFIHGYSNDGKELFERILPEGYEFSYFVKSQNETSIICDVPEEEADQYGRRRFKFLIDMSTGNIYDKKLSY